MQGYWNHNVCRQFGGPLAGQRRQFAGEPTAQRLDSLELEKQNCASQTFLVDSKTPRRRKREQPHPAGCAKRFLAFRFFHAFQRHSAAAANVYRNALKRAETPGANRDPRGMDQRSVAEPASAGQENTRQRVASRRKPPQDANAGSRTFGHSEGKSTRLRPLVKGPSRE